MKPVIRLCDMWAVYSEEEQDGILVVTGILGPGSETITAKFRTNQGGLKGSWWTTDYQPNPAEKA